MRSLEYAQAVAWCRVEWPSTMQRPATHVVNRSSRLPDLPLALVAWMRQVDVQPHCKPATPYNTRSTEGFQAVTGVITGLPRVLQINT